MKKLISKSRGKVIPFEPAGDNSQKFYEELASIPSASNGGKTDSTAAHELVNSLKSGS